MYYFKEKNYLKNGGGTTSDKYPTAKLNNVSWTSSSQNYYSIPMTVSTYKDTVASTKYGSGSGKIGVYYNYCAASAGSYCYDDADFGDIDSTEDICPAGWRMPTGGNTGEYYALAQKYTITATDTNSLQYNLSTPLSGFYFGSSASAQGSHGNWWSSTYGDSGYVYGLYVYPTSVYPGNNGNRSYGRSMRCLMSE